MLAGALLQLTRICKTSGVVKLIIIKGSVGLWHSCRGWPNGLPDFAVSGAK
jgi:hypothetical protein